ncbi:MAG: hypothetical protein WD894_25495 [Pirellulales bacterium]
MNRTDFQHLAELRVREAEALRQAGSLEGAYYLLGYAVEFALKACFCKRIAQHDFPDKKLVDKAYSHDLERLMEISGVQAPFNNAVGLNPALGLKWKTAVVWDEQSRFITSLAASEVDALFEAVLHPADGVLTWLKTQW